MRRFRRLPYFSLFALLAFAVASPRRCRAAARRGDAVQPYFTVTAECAMASKLRVGAK